MMLSLPFSKSCCSQQTSASSSKLIDFSPICNFLKFGGSAVNLEGLATSEMSYLILAIPIFIVQLINCSRKRKPITKRKRPAQIPRSPRSDPLENDSKSEEKSRNLKSEGSSQSARESFESSKKDASGQIPKNEAERPIKSEKIMKKGPETPLKAPEFEPQESSETTEGIAVPIGQSAGAVPTKSSLTDLRTPQRVRSVTFVNTPKKPLKKVLL
ncbi:unnamed protein product [Bursaphelenchus xylophilus]|uniref:(pine wood nematode) hypothetical protein n=1 Tax=Bursaphelenchus xylophilus TaxID=6326 RepID=A0A1I7SLK6_BURXY|nr:unnamed protein product [Bursaphelenchus xylophilus]CAG9129654.1 unnamed protein product [Bursaphelenchus xylophilus]